MNDYMELNTVIQRCCGRRYRFIGFHVKDVVLAPIDGKDDQVLIHNAANMKELIEYGVFTAEKQINTDTSS